jgi:hypothetical protein
LGGYKIVWAIGLRKLVAISSESMGELGGQPIRNFIQLASLNSIESNKGTVCLPISICNVCMNLPAYTLYICRAFGRFLSEDLL